MFAAKLCIGFTLTLAMGSVVQAAQIGLTVYPKNEFITGGRLTISCIDSTNNRAAYGHHIQWVKLDTMTIISNLPGARIRRDGYRLLFTSTLRSDEGLYCCRLSTMSHGCTYNSTASLKIARTVGASANYKRLNNYKVKRNHAEHHSVAKYSAGIDKTWILEANPSSRCVLLGSSASINCLNNTNGSRRFPKNIQWFRVGSPTPIPKRSLGIGRVGSDAHQLRFDRTTAEDDGLYCCRALSENECSATAVVNLTVSLPPVIYSLQNYTADEGDTVLIYCNVSAGNHVTFKWQKFGKDIPQQDEKYLILQSNNGTIFKITNVTKADEGYYNCVAKNNKYQQDNESSYLHVRLPQQMTEGCNSINMSSVTIGIQASGTLCSSLQRAILHNVTDKFLQSICNCSDYCIILNEDINCSPDNTIAVVAVTLKGDQALALKDQVYSTLRNGLVMIEFNSTEYYLLCVLNTLCKAMPTQSPIVNYNDTFASNDTNKKVAISAITVGVILSVLILTIIVILLLFHKHKKKSKPPLKTSNSVVQPEKIAITTRRESKIVEHPSTSSADTGFQSLDNTDGDRCSENNDAFYTKCFNAQSPNSSEAKHRHSAVGSFVNMKHMSDAHHCKNITPRTQSHIDNEAQKIQWSKNESYSFVEHPARTQPSAAEKVMLHLQNKGHHIETVSQKDDRFSCAAYSTQV